MKLIARIATVLLLVLSAGAALGQEDASPARIGVLLEASGAYGFQFGEQDYLPTPNGDFKHPLTNGYALGFTAGYELVPELSLIGNWEYASSTSRSGSITNVLDSVEGAIDYHTLALGMRWEHRLGPGRMVGELAGGVVLPFETEVRYGYADQMSAVSISGEGTKIDEYNLGYGAYGQIGYQWDATRNFYMGTALRVKSFQSSNNGKETRLKNFVTDFTAPAAVNTRIAYDDNGPVAPHTYSVQDLRLQLVLGLRL